MSEKTYPIPFAEVVTQRKNNDVDSEKVFWTTIDELEQRIQRA
jgi:hypothetical protein